MELDSYAPAAYLQAVRGWKQRQAVAQLCTGSRWLAVDVVGSHSLFRNGPGSRSLDVFMVQNPAEVAAFVYECKKACLALSSLSNLG